MKITPQGKIIARGEDGVPWELYENGYLLFKPTKKQNTLTNPYPSPSWKEKYGDNIIAIGFTSKVYAPEDSSYFFSKYNKNFDDKLTKLTYIEDDKIDTSNVTDMSSMFESSIIESLDLRNWNTNNVITMELMFKKASQLQTLNILNWDTRNVKYMSYMFNESTSLTYLNISKWNITNVVDMSHMFSGATVLQCLNISNWDISNVKYMSYMFYDNKNLNFLDCSQMKYIHQKIEDLFSYLIRTKKLKLNHDCIVVLPNQ